MDVTSCYQLWRAMVEYFDERYAAIAETAAATTSATVSTAVGGAGWAFQYWDLLLGHILRSRGLQLLGIREMFCTHYIPWIERERLAQEFIFGIEVSRFWSRPECEPWGLCKGVLIMLAGVSAAEGKMVNWWIGRSYYRTRLVTPRLGCIPARGRMAAGISDGISALISAGGMAWHKYLVRSGLHWTSCVGRRWLIMWSIVILGVETMSWE